MEDQFKLFAIITIPFLVLIQFPDFFLFATEEPGPRQHLVVLFNEHCAWLIPVV